MPNQSLTSRLPAKDWSKIVINTYIRHVMKNLSRRFHGIKGYQIILIFSAVFMLYSCDALMGEEIGRMSVNATSNTELVEREISLSLQRGDKISFWVDMDMEYEGDLQMACIVEIWKDSTLLGSVEMDALKTNPTVMEIKTSFGSQTSWEYSGKMNFMSVEEPGKYTLKGSFYSNEIPSLNLIKAEIVLKK